MWPLLHRFLFSFYISFEILFKLSHLNLFSLSIVDDMGGELFFYLKFLMKYFHFNMLEM